MKRFLILFTIVVFFSGCAGFLERYKKKEINEVYFMPGAGEERTARSGELFFEHYVQRGEYHDPTFVTGENLRFVLTVIDVDEEVLRLRYIEYQKPVVPPAWTIASVRGFSLKDRWQPRRGSEVPVYFYLKRIKDKIITFKDYEFKILKVEEGSITYKRIK